MVIAMWLGDALTKWRGFFFKKQHERNRIVSYQISIIDQRLQFRQLLRKKFVDLSSAAEAKRVWLTMSLMRPLKRSTMQLV